MWAGRMCGRGIRGRWILHLRPLHVSPHCHPRSSRRRVLLVAVLGLSIRPPVLPCPCHSLLGGGPVVVYRLIGLWAVVVWSRHCIPVLVLCICTLRLLLLLLLLQLLLLLLLLLRHGHGSGMLLHVEHTPPGLILPARKPALLLVDQTHGCLHVLPVVIIDIHTTSKHHRVMVAS